MPTGNTTVPSTNDVAATLRARAELAPALVIVWSARQPHRVGEVAMFDGIGPWVLGRERVIDANPAVFVLQRPQANEIGAWLVGSSMSRRQVEIERTMSGLRVRSVGNATMRVNGVETVDHELVDGEVLELVGHYMMMMTTRPANLGDAFDWPPFPFGGVDAFGVVGESPAAWRLRADIAFAARAPVHVLVHGPSGTGEELCATGIHALSRRARGPFIARNAATFPVGLVDSELFGHAKNYPNAGMPEREGLLATAHGGTLFLDEIGEVPIEVQARLLRFLDSGEYHRLGEARARHADVRVVCATNRDPSTLKHDLVARLKVAIETPAIASRREDIPLILRHILSSSPTAVKFVRDGQPLVSASLVTKLVRAPFETNVRELEHVLLRAIRFCDDPPLRLPDLAAIARAPTAGDEIANLRAVLERHDWNVSRAAEALGMSSRHVLARLMKKHGIQAP